MSESFLLWPSLLVSFQLHAYTPLHIFSSTVTLKSEERQEVPQCSLSAYTKALTQKGRGAQTAHSQHPVSEGIRIGTTQHFVSNSFSMLTETAISIPPHLIICRVKNGKEVHMYVFFLHSHFNHERKNWNRSTTEAQFSLPFFFCPSLRVCLLKVSIQI